MAHENDSDSLTLVGLGVGVTFEWDLATSELPSFIVPVDEVIVGAVTVNRRYQSLFAPVTRSLWREHKGNAKRIISSVIEPLGIRTDRSFKLLLPENPETMEVVGVGGFEGAILDVIRPIFRMSGDVRAPLTRPKWHQPGHRFKDTDLHSESVVDTRIRGWVLNDQVARWARPSFNGIQMIGTSCEYDSTPTGRVIQHQGDRYQVVAMHLRLKLPPQFPPPFYTLAGCVVHHGQYVNGLQPIYRQMGLAGDGAELHHGPVVGRVSSDGPDAATVLLAPPGQCVVGYQGRSGLWMDAFGLIYGDPVTGEPAGESEVLGGTGGSAFPPRMSGGAVSGVMIRSSGGKHIDGIAFLIPVRAGNEVYLEELSEVEL